MSDGQNNPNAMHELKTHKPAESAVRSIGLVLPQCEAIKKRGGKCGMPAKYEICERDEDTTPVCSLHQTVAATHGWKTRRRQNDQAHPTAADSADGRH